MITVFRLGHRVARDKRISTHCALVARALGAGEIIFSGEPDDVMIQSVQKVVGKWGGDFKISYEPGWKKTIKGFAGIKVHLTVYGLPFQTQTAKIRKIAKTKDVMVIIGGAKVPSEVYSLSDFNLSVTTQPHSEVAALALFLHDLFEGKELKLSFANPKIRVKPSQKTKIVEKLAEPLQKI